MQYKISHADLNLILALVRGGSLARAASLLHVDVSTVFRAIRRLETVIAGTQSKGAAGENILDVVFSKLPAEWQVRNFPVGNKSVEFGLRFETQEQDEDEDDEDVEIEVEEEPVRQDAEIVSLDQFRKH